MKRRDLETSRIDFRQHARKDLPDGHLQGFAGTVSRGFLSGAIEEVNAPFNIRGDEPGSQAINNAVAVCLEKCNLSGGLLQFHAGPSPALRQEIREKRNRAETENIQADDVLQRWKIGPDICRRRNITEIAEVQVREMEQRACGSRNERSPPLKEDARHHDFEEIKRRKIAVEAARPVDGPGDEQQINSNLSVGLCDVRWIQFEEREPARRQRID